MTTRRFVFRTVIAAALAMATLTGTTACAKRYKGPDAPKAEAKALEASKANVNILDTKLSSRIASELFSRERLEDGRLGVKVNLRNRTGKQLHVQARTVFKDINGMSNGDETSWENLYLSPRQAMTYRATSLSKDAESFSVEVRRP